MKTLNENYAKNVEILRINLGRGMTQAQASAGINALQNKFLIAGLYDQDAEDFINEMRAVVVSHFTKIEVVLL